MRYTSLASAARSLMETAKNNPTMVGNRGAGFRQQSTSKPDEWRDSDNVDIGAKRNQSHEKAAVDTYEKQRQDRDDETAKRKQAGDKREAALLSALKEDEASEQRKKIHTVARPDDPKPTDAKSKHARQAEIQTKVIDEVTRTAASLAEAIKRVVTDEKKKASPPPDEVKDGDDDEDQVNDGSPKKKEKPDGDEDDKDHPEPDGDEDDGKPDDGDEDNEKDNGSDKKKSGKESDEDDEDRVVTGDTETEVELEPETDDRSPDSTDDDKPSKKSVVPPTKLKEATGLEGIFKNHKFTPAGVDDNIARHRHDYKHHNAIAGRGFYGATAKAHNEVASQHLAALRSFKKSKEFYDAGDAKQAQHHYNTGASHAEAAANWRSHYGLELPPSHENKKSLPQSMANVREECKMSTPSREQVVKNRQEAKRPPSVKMGPVNMNTVSDGGLSREQIVANRRAAAAKRATRENDEESGGSGRNVKEEIVSCIMQKIFR